MPAIIKQFFYKSHEMTLSDPRFISLNQWLNRYFSYDVTPILISGDASFRRYFRVVARDASYIVADSPPALVPIAPFIALASSYAAAGLTVPKVITTDAEQGFMLLSDLGDTQLLSVLTDDNVADYYRRALALLPQVASVVESFDPVTGNTQPLPLYDEAFVRRELEIFTEWLLERHLQLELSHEERLLLEKSFGLLVENALAQPKVGMHRDFHSRNLMLKEGELCVIDFQDAVLGPVTYDAVSLLRDCYIRWPQTMVLELMQQHYQQVLELGQIPAQTSFTQYQTWFDLMGLQRHIKAAGIFARLHYRDNKPAYMADIPLTLSYIVDIASVYPELAPFSAWVQSRVVPAFAAKGKDTQPGDKQ
ncbi:aminoglycoside phosphotransferase family protein [Shewanella xiamenensis]|uniref:aminoglycoside phosphotransferase family protein n=1 Tax=Shewanella xiamenensis TaxID=332186 RepID=UPI00166C8813|nr:phosphotransferase [Shewanella xiamenensis]MCL1070371.1 phosphotransferase [Shewanella xiamenensis]MDI5836599.1 phosphotransferase [Shewanella xiamenensis]MDI5840848.1 phosphotransferase [Shewanella xiamenensis]MDI5845148.1 phosphotransferase [Shewanella xiamenensis]MDI5848927.1 phosphotransferase [Shewanella xiamenensis]